MRMPDMSPAQTLLRRRRVLSARLRYATETVALRFSCFETASAARPCNCNHVKLIGSNKPSYHVIYDTKRAPSAGLLHRPERSKPTDETGRLPGLDVELPLAREIAYQSFAG